MSIVSKAKISVGTFSPKTSIDGCQLWLDAADPAGTGTPPSNNATVATWKDKSGKGRDSPANSTGATFNTNSQNGNGALSFTTGQYYITPSFVATANNTPTIFLVCQQTSAGSGNSEIIMASIGTPYGYYTLDIFGGGATKILLLNIYGNANQNGGISIANSTLISVVGTGSPTYTATMWGNGTSNVSFTGSSVSPMSISSPYNIGAISAFIGKIYEVLFYDTPLGDNARQQVEGYLAQKWGLTSSLPPGHPGLTQTFYGLVKSTVVVPIILIPYNIYTNYNPLTATGSTCILWLDASDPTTLFSDVAGTTLASASGTVGYWRDKSSSGFNCTQTTLSYRPTYVAAAKNGRSILSFNGLTNFLNLPQFTAVPLTIFFVAQGTVFLPNTFFLSLGATGSTVMMRMLYTQQTYGVDGTSLLIPTTNSDTNWHLWTLTISSSTVTFYFDGTLIGTSSWANGSGYTFATNTIASWNQQVGSKATTLNIPEILFYSAVLGTTQQQQVEAYLTEKWGLTSQTTRGVASIVAVAKRVRVQYIQTFTYTGANQTFVVPATTTSITVYMWGAGGGGNTNYGGAGAMVQGVFITIPGETLNILVGQGGTIDGSITFGGGGAGAGLLSSSVGIGYTNNLSGGSPQNGGSGGGRSAIQRGGTAATNDIVVVGGGGGGTFFSSDYGGSATFSGTANPGAGGLPGLGGTQTAGGAGGGTGVFGQGLGGSLGTGGNTYNTNTYNGGGGGGGGYYGGGAGGTNAGDGAGGGGGSSLTSNLSLIVGQSILGYNSTDGYTAPNTGSSYYQSGVANGAPSVNSLPRAGGPGLVVFVYTA